MAAVVRAAPVAVAAGQGSPVDRNGQIQADGLAVIKQQQVRIRALEQQALGNQVREQKTAQGYENQLYAISQEKQALTDQLAASQQQVAALTALFEQRQAEVEQLRAMQVQNGAQIAASLRESAALNAQLVQERARGQLLTQQIEGLRRQSEQQNAQIQQQAAEIHRQGAQIRETLELLQKQHPPESSLLANAGEWLLKAFVNGMRGFPPSAYYE